jgi:S-ribosylhomocysteine lyase
MKMELKKIASFTVDHNTLKKGIYISRIDGDITTYDIRMKLPNMGDYLENKALHTLEHLIATFLRSGEKENEIIYFGPMGCRTGFYLLVRNIEPKDVIELIKSAFKFSADFSGTIPGTTAIECGNYLDHDLSGAKQEANEFLLVIQNYTVERLKY